MNRALFRTLCKLRSAIPERLEGTVPFRQVVERLERWGGLSCYDPEPYREIGKIPFEVAKGIWMLLDPVIWGQRMSLIRGQYYERSLCKFITAELKAEDTFVDIGANVGFYTLIASEIVGATGRVFAFEPVPSTFEVLQGAVLVNRLSNCRLRSVALGSEATESEMVVPHCESGGSNLLGRYDGALTPVTVSIGDEELAQINPAATGIVKIDVEGFELQVVRGLRQTLARCPGLIYVVEVTPEWIARQGESVDELFEIFRSHRRLPYRLTQDGTLQSVQCDIAGQENIVFK